MHNFSKYFDNSLKYDPQGPAHTLLSYAFVRVIELITQQRGRMFRALGVLLLEPIMRKRVGSEGGADGGGTHLKGTPGQEQG